MLFTWQRRAGWHDGCTKVLFGKHRNLQQIFVAMDISVLSVYIIFSLALVKSFFQDKNILCEVARSLEVSMRNFRS